MSNPGVLVIDDDPAVREALDETLGREGYTLLFAQDGREGLDRLRDDSPNLVILALRMPGVDGLEFLRRISVKKTDPYSVIVLTAFGDDATIKACYESGVAGLLRKPFNITELRASVYQALRSKAVINQLQSTVSEWRRYSQVFRSLVEVANGAFAWISGRGQFLYANEA
jgi:two-component system response regulator (stage 0 sporulation protein F)